MKINGIDNKTNLPIVIEIEADQDNGPFISLTGTTVSGYSIFDIYIDTEQSAELLRDAVGEAAGNFQRMLDRQTPVE